MSQQRQIGGYRRFRLFNSLHALKWRRAEEALEKEKCKEIKVSQRKMLRSRQYKDIKIKEKAWRTQFWAIWNQELQKNECYVLDWQQKMKCKFEAKYLSYEWEKYSLQNYHEIDQKHTKRNQGLRFCKIYIKYFSFYQLQKQDHI
ncbi:hypothetical protein ABPG74_016363 [Tetrahymena malaccensis]